MRELSEPKARSRWPGDDDLWSGDQVLAIQKQAYDDGLKDAESLCEKNGFDDGFGCASLIRDLLKTSQKEVCNICGKQHIDPSFNCLLINQVILDLKSAREAKSEAKTKGGAT